MVDIALFQPEIALNVGAQIRLAACMGVGLRIIEPCGFPWNERKIRQSALDYLIHVNYARHNSWQSFKDDTQEQRVILMTTKASRSYIDFEFKENDILLAGSESAGVPDDIHDAVEARIAIPMQGGLRSLNIVNATSMILGEALRQTRWR